MTLTIRTLVNTEHLIACGLFGLKSVIILDHFVKKSLYAACHDHKIYLHTKFGIPTSNCIQICSGLDLARTKTRGQGHSKLETVGDSPGPKMYLHTKYGTATIHK